MDTSSIKRKTLSLLANKGLLFIFLSITWLPAQWQVIDSVSFTMRIPAKDKGSISFEKAADTLRITLPESKLIQKAVEAIDYAPSWLGIALEDKLSQLSTSLQDKFAQIILDAKDPYVDEIAFTIAHLSVEILTHNEFYPAVIVENAQRVYSNDSSLDYVAVVDTGSASAGGDYFSTTRYSVEENGNIKEFSLPRDIYYWYIVHPKLQGEFVSYINPSGGSPAKPPSGRFWRSYLFNHKENNYSALRDTMKGISTLWNSKTNDPPGNGAIGRLSQWVMHVLPWGTAQYPRIPQPIHLYHCHTGTCSEHGWFANGAARTVLIPATLTKGARFDHKWNEFFERSWRDFEPVNNWINRLADDYWGEPERPNLNGCFNWRGDGFIWGTTEHYSKVCTLNVTVTDAYSNPVDGARITVDANGVGGPFLICGWTNSNGMCRFLLGDSIPSFTAAIQSDIGSVSAQRVISNSEIGESYTYAANLQGSIPELKAILNSVTTDSTDTQKVVFEINHVDEIVYGKHNYSFGGYTFPCTFSDRRNTGTIDFFICDEVNFTSYAKGSDFNSPVIRKDASQVDSSFTMPDDKRWYCVFSNEDKAVNTTLVCVTVRLLKNSGVPIITTERENINKLQHVEFKKNSAIFSYSLGQTNSVSVTIYNVLGKCVEHFSHGNRKPGKYSLSWKTSDCSKGMYYYRFEIGNELVCGTLLVIE